MPAFVLALIKLVIAAVTSIAAFLATYITKRIALVAAAVTVIIGLTAALWAALHALVAAAVVTAPSEVTGALGWVAPNNIVECMTIIISAKATRYVYDFQTKTVQMRLF
jgi:uncharacterized membrane protein SpoIIM required for sporulation